MGEGVKVGGPGRNNLDVLSLGPLCVWVFKQ